MSLADPFQGSNTYHTYYALKTCGRPGLTPADPFPGSNAARPRMYASSGKKISETQLQKVPYMLVLGDKDVEAGTVDVRSREDGDLGAMTVEAFLERLQ